MQLSYAALAPSQPIFLATRSPNAMAYDAGLVERLRDSLMRAGENGTRERGVFGGRGFLLGKSTFLIAYVDQLLVKATPEEYPALLAMAGITPFAPGDERPMGTWLVVPSDAVADDPELLEWVERGLRGVRAAPLTKRRARKPAVEKAPAKMAKQAAKVAKTARKVAKTARNVATKGAEKGAEKAGLLKKPASAAKTPKR
ncbi:MAG: TfoX/Sxy family protein [Gemmatimonadaceae bacterium]